MRNLVKLYVYNLLGGHDGSCRSSCPSTGGGIPLLYHTSIVAYGNEYSFNRTDGVTVKPSCEMVDRADDIPDKTMVLGHTSKTNNELAKFVENLKSTTFQKENYELLQLNCHEFCIKLCEFLGVEGLPEYVTAVRQLAKDVFGSEAALDMSLNLAAGAAGIAAVAGFGYLAYKRLSKNNSNKN